jgi:hypothetical protein
MVSKKKKKGKQLTRALLNLQVKDAANMVPRSAVATSNPKEKSELTAHICPVQRTGPHVTDDSAERFKHALDS